MLSSTSHIDEIPIPNGMQRSAVGDCIETRLFTDFAFRGTMKGTGAIHRCHYNSGRTHPTDSLLVLESDRVGVVFIATSHIESIIFLEYLLPKTLPTLSYIVKGSNL